MSRVAQVLIVVAAIVVIGASIADAGWVVSETGGEEVQISKGKMRSDWESGAVIFDGNSNTIYFFDDSRKLMASATPEEICSSLEDMVNSAMEAIPEEQREMMKKMRGEGNMPKVELIDKGAGEKVSGFPTTKYDVMANGDLYEEVWVANDKKLMADCGAVMKMMGKFSSCMESVSMMGGSVSPEATPEYVKLFEIGIPVKTVTHADEEGGGEPEITGIVEKDIPDSAFKLPEGYKKVSVAEIFGMAGE